MKISGMKGINTYVYIYHKTLLDDIVFKSDLEQKRGTPRQLSIQNLYYGNTDVLGTILKHYKNT